MVFRLVSLGVLVLAANFTNVSAHSEHDKARFVASSGQDSGFCDNALRPCASIAYAVTRANKGDKVLVASGSYAVKNAEELFYLKSEIVPILAGFNRFDHFQNQSPDLNPTFLTGVPMDMRDALRSQGFNVVADGKANDASEVLAQKMAAFEILSQEQTDKPCTGGSAAGFACNNIDLVAHMPLGSFSSRPNEANDIWGHVDLNTGREYALMGVRNGIAVIDVSNPDSPAEVGTIPGSNSTWRDVKVFQYFDEAAGSFKAYAYSTVDSSNDGVTIIDLNNLPDSISLVERSTAANSAHNVYISNIDHSLNIALDQATPVLQLIGANRYSGSFHSYSLAAPETLNRVDNQSSFGGYTHDGASVIIEDSRKDSDCVNASDACSVFVDFNENEINLWDISDPADTQLLSSASYNDVSAANQYIHSGWVTDDKRYVLVHDEFDENRGGLNSTVRIFQIDDLKAPVQVGQWTGPTRAIDHNGFVRGNRYYMSNYERGLTILDIEDPANPQEVGYFDTFPTSNNASFNGAWGVYPYLPSGVILVSDINSGLYLLRDKTQSLVEGNIHFAGSQIKVDQNANATIEVTRSLATAASAATSVSYELISGSAKSDEDFTLVTGDLSWGAGENGVKSFEVAIADDLSGSEVDETFYVRLFDPKSGATLTSPSYLTVVVNGIPNAGMIEFSTADITVAENSGEVTVNIARLGGDDGAASVDYLLVANTATSDSDFVQAGGTINWADADETNKTISISILDDELDEVNEDFSIQLNNVNGAGLGGNSSVQVTITDDDSNQAPAVVVSEDFQVNTGQTVELSATASDVEGDDLSYSWRQIAGMGVTITNDLQLVASFVAPTTAGELEFELTVTDSKGAETKDQVKVTVIAVTNPPEGDDTEESSGSGSIGFLALAFLLMIGRRRVAA